MNGCAVRSYAQAWGIRGLRSFVGQYHDEGKMGSPDATAAGVWFMAAASKSSAGVVDADRSGESLAHGTGTTAFALAVPFAVAQGAMSAFAIELSARVGDDDPDGGLAASRPEVGVLANVPHTVPAERATTAGAVCVVQPRCRADYSALCAYMKLGKF